MPQRLRKPRLPRFGEPPAAPPRAVHVRATSVHGIPIDLRLSPAAEVLSHPSAFSQAKTVNTRGSFASFVRALHAPSDGLTVEVEAFCATPPAVVPTPGTALLLPKVPTPNPLPDRTNAPTPPARQGAPLPAPIGAPVQPPAPSNAGPPPSLEELAALAEIRDLAGTPAPPAPQMEAPFPPPPAPKPANAPAPALAPQAVATSVGHAHDVFDRMAPPMAMTFDVGNVSLQRQFSALDAHLDREAARSRNRGRVARAASIDDVSLANDLAGMRWAMGAHAGHAHVAEPVAPAPTQAPEPSPPMPSLLLPNEPAPAPATSAVKLIDARALLSGDVVVVTEVRAPSTLSERLPGDAPPSRTLLSLGSAQVAEPFGSGVVVRTVTEALATAAVAIAFRPAAIVPTLAGDASVPANLLAYLGHLKAPTTR